MGIFICPGCGSEDLVEWGTSMRMCRHCHLTFRIEDAHIVDEEEAVQEDAEFAETTDDEISSYAGFEETEDEETTDEDLGIILKSSYNSTVGDEPGSDSQEQTEGATAQFEDFYARLKEEQRIEDEQRAAALQAKPVEKKRKTDAKKVLPWVIIPIIIWLILTIICLVN